MKTGVEIIFSESKSKGLNLQILSLFLHEKESDKLIYIAPIFVTISHQSQNCKKKKKKILNIG